LCQLPDGFADKVRNGFTASAFPAKAIELIALLVRDAYAQLVLFTFRTAHGV
jgi:hypothetical protein